MNSAPSHEITTAWGTYGQIIRLIPYDDQLYHVAVGWPHTDRWVITGTLTGDPHAFAVEVEGRRDPMFQPARLDRVVAAYGLPWKDATPLDDEPPASILDWMFDGQSIEGLLELRRWLGGNVGVVTPWLQLLAEYRSQSLADRWPDDALGRLRGE